MNITISKSELSRGLYLTQSIVEKRTTMPILVNLLLTASNGELTISSTDLEITSVARLKASCQSRGSTTVNARVFSEIVKELPDEDIKIEASRFSPPAKAGGKQEPAEAG